MSDLEANQSQYKVISSYKRIMSHVTKKNSGLTLSWMTVCTLNSFKAHQIKKRKRKKESLEIWAWRFPV
jgi:hypothetical protein